MLKTLSSEGVFIFGGDNIILYLTVIIIFTVAYVNGWTDAPNSIAACVATNVLPIKKAVKIAALADFIGSLSVGLLSGKVSDKIIELTEFEGNGELFIASVFSAMLSVVIWAVTAWYFGIPTSESHAMLAGVFGSSCAIHHGTDNIKIDCWVETGLGLLASIAVGYMSGFILSKVTCLFANKESTKRYENIQIISGIITSFLHGAQDSQKFSGLITAVLIQLNPYINIKKASILVTVLCAFFISLGTATGGDRIIKSVGNDMVKLNKIQGFSADISGLLCLLIFTLCGVPVSTTHIKTASILGAGTVNGNVNRKTVQKMFAAWVLTFPVCSFLSYLITCFITK